MGVILALLLSLIMSCSGFDTEIKKNDIVSFNNPLAILGDFHNQAMDSLVYYKVSLDNLESVSFEFVERKFLQYYEIPKETITDYQKDFLSMIKQQAIEKKDHQQTRAELYNELGEMTAEMSKVEIAFINDIFSLIIDGISDISEINNTFSKIDSDINASTELTQDEKNGLWAVSAIARASYEYNVNNGQTRAATLEGVVTTDAQAALAGLVSWRRVAKTVASGLVFGPTGIVVAVAKEMAYSAIVGSGIYFCCELI